MKVNLTIDLSEAERYIIATYFREANTSTVLLGGRRGGKRDLAAKLARHRTRTRATRDQARLYIRGAVRLCLRERVDGLQKGRTKTIALRLERQEPEATVKRRASAIVPPAERNARLFS